MKNLLLVFFGGGLGSVLRYLISVIMPYKSGIPYATLSVNILGSLLIGLLIAYFAKQSHAQYEPMMLVLIVGFCGGFTTFSTFSKEGFLLIQQQQWLTFFIYICLSFILCIVSVALGFFIMK